MYLCLLFLFFRYVSISVYIFSAIHLFLSFSSLGHAEFHQPFGCFEMIPNQKGQNSADDPYQKSYNSKIEQTLNLLKACFRRDQGACNEGEHPCRKHSTGKDI